LNEILNYTSSLNFNEPKKLQNRKTACAARASKNQDVLLSCNSTKSLLK
jgi:hypothetical protein